MEVALYLVQKYNICLKTRFFFTLFLPISNTKIQEKFTFFVFRDTLGIQVSFCAFKIFT